MTVSDQNHTANSAKRAAANISVSDSLLYISASSVLSCHPIYFVYQFQKFLHFPDSSDPPVRYSGSAAGNQKQIAREIPADGTVVLTLMGSLPRMLDQG